MKKHKKNGARPWLRAVALTLCLSTAHSVAGEALVERELSTLSPLEQSELEVQLTDKINEALRGHRFSEEQPGPIIVTVRLDLQKGKLLVDLGEENGPWSESLEMEDLQKGITAIAIEVLGDTTGWHGVDLRFGGKDMYFWFPELRPQDEKALAPKSARKKRAAEPEKVLLSAGHGVYFHHGFKDWRPQRERSFSILEDDITQDFVEELNEHLSKEEWWKVPSPYLPVLTRSLGSDVHEPSSRPWRDLAARYWLEKLYPQNPEIWHSMPNSKSPQRERLEDIHSRLKFANHIDAAAAIHVHTNGSPKTSTRGAIIFYQEGSIEGQRLASSLACHLDGVLHSHPEFSDYVVNRVARDGDYAELKGANMPSALVEIGFHTNKDDAAAMASKRFRIIATAGLRKGYDSFRKGQPCETFKVTGITNIETTFRKITMNMPYVGNPTLPIYMNIRDQDGKKMLVRSSLSKIPNTLEVSMLCDRQRARTKFKAIVEDEDYASTQLSFVADCWLFGSGIGEHNDDPGDTVDDIDAEGVDS